MLKIRVANNKIDLDNIVNLYIQNKNRIVEPHEYSNDSEYIKQIFTNYIHNKLIITFYYPRI